MQKHVKQFDSNNKEHKNYHNGLFVVMSKTIFS
jgi:hypothetical protein